MHRNLIQFARYLLVGGLNYGVDIGMFLLLFNFFKIDLLLDNMISKVLAGIFSFVAYRAFTSGVIKDKGRAQTAGHALFHSLGAKHSSFRLDSVCHAMDHVNGSYRQDSVRRTPRIDQLYAL